MCWKVVNGGRERVVDVDRLAIERTRVRTKDGTGDYVNHEVTEEIETVCGAFGSRSGKSLNEVKW